ncbi:UBA4 (YHR111W) [Zygosaccharomyces parabailii]|nr:UBA4 (YHR111W) [Zygosaccharomyces parabailii]
MSVPASGGSLTELESLRLENDKLKKKLNEKQQLNECSMTLEEYTRYGRQMIVEGTGGVSGQLKLRSAKVLVVGAGGLGCPALPYLAGAGVGQIGIIDNDIVDSSNLHRQVLHSTKKVGMLKCESAKQVLLELNPNVSVETYPIRLEGSNAFDIFEKYDYILDCTDTPMSRYLISDVAVISGKTVVSASGLGTEGQLTILNYNNIGPCYRCFYPKPPTPNSVSSCQEGGVIGPCIGLVGVMMAVEALKLVMGVYDNNFSPFLKLYSGFPEQTLRTFKMRGRQRNCSCCGENPSITRHAIESGVVSYTAFCGSRNYDVCDANERMSVAYFEEQYRQRKDFILLDVRPSHHYSISHFPDTHNIPLKSLQNMKGSLSKLRHQIPNINPDSEVVVICRHGNESQLATRLLKDDFGIPDVKDIRGGFFKYIDEVDPSIPKY